jgi:hypothetical protein
MTCSVTQPRRDGGRIWPQSVTRKSRPWPLPGSLSWCSLPSGPPHPHGTVSQAEGAKGAVDRLTGVGQAHSPGPETLLALGLPAFSFVDLHVSGACGVGEAGRD